jgi:competence protein ComEA
MYMKRQLQEYFYYTKRERKGTIALVSLCLLLLLVPYCYRYFIKPPVLDKNLQKQLEQWMIDTTEEQEAGVQPLFPFDPNTISKDSLILLGLSPKVAQTIINYRNKVGRFKAKSDLKKIYTLKAESYNRLEAYILIETPEKSTSHRQQKAQIKNENFPFDPNTATEQTLKQLGLSDAAVRNILKYRAKGGRFYAAKDINKIYGIDKKRASELEPYIQINPQNEEVAAEDTPMDENRSSTLKKNKTTNWTPPTIDINESEADDWQKLKGIGPSYAQRIIRFREALGGFVTVDQVAQAYQLPDSTFQQIKPFLKASPIYRKLPINEADAASLKAHPYLNWKQARAIANYRLQHGDYQRAEDLKKVKLLPPELVERLEPYLEF